MRSRPPAVARSICKDHDKSWGFCRVVASSREWTQRRNAEVSLLPTTVTLGTLPTAEVTWILFSPLYGWPVMVAACPAKGSRTAGLVIVQWTPLLSVMVAASSLTLPEIVVIFEDIFESLDLVEDWAAARVGNKSTAAKQRRMSFFMGRLFATWKWVVQMRGSVRLKFRESNRKNELEQFKIMRRFADAPGQWRAALCPQARVSPLATSNFGYT